MPSVWPWRLHCLRNKVSIRLRAVYSQATPRGSQAFIPSVWPWRLHCLRNKVSMKLNAVQLIKIGYFWCIASPQQGDLRPGHRWRGSNPRKVHADLRTVHYPLCHQRTAVNEE
ncbi:hypothetical protein PoB_005970500 [Plakobranchus ocellatus]|uniref:Uncharacterized protein n=1 Tax=Plakobranchus ocellatus TaxID=259542 RepID=A0AAV4CM96_9GAST|nr:hypothetical protein PoB_005970500 [Plakobranchus ocellatus]